MVRVFAPSALCHAIHNRPLFPSEVFKLNMDHRLALADQQTFKLILEAEQDARDFDHGPALALNEDCDSDLKVLVAMDLEEAHEMNKVYNADRGERLKAFFGFAPAAKWTPEQKARALEFARSKSAA